MGSSIALITNTLPSRESLFPMLSVPTWMLTVLFSCFLLYLHLYPKSQFMSLAVDLAQLFHLLCILTFFTRSKLSNIDSPLQQIVSTLFSGGRNTLPIRSKTGTRWKTQTCYTPESCHIASSGKIKTMCEKKHPMIWMLGSDQKGLRKREKRFAPVESASI